MNTVHTAQGPVQGEHRAEVTVYHAVPYAAPVHATPHDHPPAAPPTPTHIAASSSPTQLPPGSARPATTPSLAEPDIRATTPDTRFATPTPPSPRVGIHDATTPGSTAPAPHRLTLGRLNLTPLNSPTTPGPDYRTLTIWTPPTATTPRPVLVFLHGGGFQTGSGSAPLYDGTAFARDGILLVTVNYRLGAPGWLHLPDAPANRGLLDVIAALEWLRDNISAFGGDPHNITVAGQSAGAMLATGLLAAPRAHGLFQRVISQSGNPAAVLTPEQAYRVTEALATELGVAATAAGFAGVADADLIAGLGRIPLPSDGPLRGITPFGLVLDPDTLPRPPTEAVLPPVDLLIGINTDEANLYLVPTGRQAPWLTTEALFGAGSRQLAQAHATQLPGRTHRYRFAWRSDAFDGALGACHCVELPFVFANTAVQELHGVESLLGPTPPSPTLVARTHAAWSRFVSTGDPGWPAYTAATPHSMRIDEQWTLTTPAE
ncbi:MULTISPECIES: carboxylesterase/lipase family protein [unclassified Crossiella]|uniref:carboxylesterase/lipase family protein n=1 Tax=unclassified Crossiella TaxID=2620835 RepID=UPI001FFE919E|nr:MULTISPECIES: carboxylesterase family protein [unclassified Crossiella]MCK2238468.1 carboxylesterase family protein [Crossiella sp. S99.2]MCK2251962.1 carboxylesterase family protein [Crossiella sp. S99.1]